MQNKIMKTKTDKYYSGKGVLIGNITSKAID